MLPGESLLLQTRIKFPPMPLREILPPRPSMGYTAAADATEGELAATATHAAATKD